MKKNFLYLLVVLTISISSCLQSNSKQLDKNSDDDFKYFSETFADLKVLRYKIPDFEKLSLNQKKLVYFLGEAGLCGRDIIWDQNYRHNLHVRKVLEAVLSNYKGDRSNDDFAKFEVYTKRVWFSNGIHHHYSNSKIKAEFSQEYFLKLCKESDVIINDEALKAIFDPKFDNKKVNKNPDLGLVKGSAVNFYDPDITEAEVDAYYNSIKDKDDLEPISYGLNSKLIRNKEGKLEEKVYKLGGMYSKAIEQIIFWLSKAVEVAENEDQKKGLELLIEYYRTGNLETWDEYNIVWAAATKGDIDYINSFIEVYNDPKAYTGSFESIVEIKDFEASARMKTLEDNVQWFEDNSSIMDEHKKENVTGVTYKVVNVASESGDASPSTPIGVNLPNSNWIRAKHGSKSVSLGNIVSAYDGASGKGTLKEFELSEEARERSKKYGKLAGKLHTALHEVVGHASGKLNPGVGTPKETLKNYGNTLEEGRADLVALYFILDSQLIKLGLMPSLDVGRAEYDGYIRNGLMLQMRRIEKGDDIEEAHMRNRQMVAGWAYEKGKEENVIERFTDNGNTYFRVNDYEKLRVLFGELLKEIQRIKSEGDYEAGKNLVENYGVKVDTALHAEVLERAKKLNTAPYGGFINPKLVAVKNQDGVIEDIKVEYPESFSDQMLNYSKSYGFLPEYN